MRNVLAGLTAAFLMTSSMTAASVALVQAAAAKTAQPTEDQSLTAFFDAGYAWCDAKVLAQYWNTDPSSSKVWAGEKILRGDQNILDEALGAAYQRHRCNIAFDTGDGAQLAALWAGQISG